MREIASGVPGGWIKLYRAVLEKGWVRNHKLWAFWTWCLLKASYEEKVELVGNQQVSLMPGQFIFRYKDAMQDLGLTMRETRTALANLKNLENVTSKTTNKFSVITVVNWGFYQGNTDDIDKQSDTSPTSKRQTKKAVGHSPKGVQTPKNIRNKEEKNTGTRPVIDYFFSRVKETKGVEPKITGKDGAMVKSALKTSSPERVKNQIDFYLDSKKSENHLSPSAALSADTTNSYLLAWQKQRFQWPDEQVDPPVDQRWWE